jgi:hypothetical protein
MKLSKKLSNLALSQGNKMDNRFITCIHQHNKRLVEMLIERVLNESITENSALAIAHDTWKTSTGVFSFEDKRQLELTWALSLSNQLS